MSLPANHREHSVSSVFFSLIGDQFGQAAQTVGGAEEYRLAMGGQVILLRFAGPALVERIMPAFRHLELPGSTQQPTLTVALWDSVSTSVPMPPPPWDCDDYRERGEVRGYNDERFHTAYSLGSGVLSMLDTTGQQGYFWVRDATGLAYWESGAPLLNLLHWWFGDGQKQLLHAAAVGHPDGGVLLVGRGGSGKSTTALAALLAGLSYVGDDYCLLDAGPQPRVYSLYNSAKLNPDNLRRFPQLGRMFNAAGCRVEDKVLVFLGRRHPDKVVAGFPLKGVLLPQISGKTETCLEPVSPATGLKALAPSTLFQLSGAGQNAFRTMAAFVQKVPCYRLNLGTDLDGVVRSIAGFLETATVRLQR